MIRKIQILIFTFLFSLGLHAQIPNGGFESWAGGEMVGWVTTNGLMQIPGGNPQTVFQTGDSQTGSFACQMVAGKIINKPSGVFVPTYAASIFVGVQKFLTSIRGFAYSNKPANFEFWYKYWPTPGDSANGFVALTRWDAANAKRDTIAVAGFYHATLDTLSYKKAIIPLTYLNALTPDTAIILFSAVTLSATQSGAKFSIDDLAFTGGDVGVSEQKEEQIVNLFPNPSHGVSTIRFGKVQTATSLFVYDIQGKQIWQEELNNLSEINIPTQQFLPGIYFIGIKNEQGELYKKLEVQN